MTLMDSFVESISLVYGKAVPLSSNLGVYICTFHASQKVLVHHDHPRKFSSTVPTLFLGKSSLRVKHSAEREYLEVE